MNIPQYAKATEAAVTALRMQAEQLLTAAATVLAEAGTYTDEAERNFQQARALDIQWAAAHLLGEAQKIETAAAA